jgi:periplasmic protein CpxP/Spy
MFKRIFAVLMLAALVGVVSAAAQNSDQQSGPAEGHRRHFDPQQRTEMLTKQLKLNSDQQAKVLDSLKAEQSQMESLRSDSSLSQDDRRAKMMDIHKQSNDQIRGLLDSNQQKKWDEMQSRHDWNGHHGGDSNQGPGGNS